MTESIDMNVPVDIHLGELPAFWDRGAVFIANLKSIFYGNARQVDELQAEVRGLESYGGRLAPILNLLYRKGPNVLVLEREPDPILIGYLRDDLKLSLPSFEILSYGAYHALAGEGAGSPEQRELHQRLESHAARHVDGFVTDEVLVRLAGDLRKATTCSLEGSRRGNNKLLLHHHLEEQGLPVFDTRIACSEHDARHAVRELRASGYPRVVIKSQVGASGIGMLHLRNEDVRVSPHLFYEGPCLVQGWLDGTMPGCRIVGSPSVQLFVREDAVSVYDMTEQVLSEDSVHQGNISPPPYLAEYPGLETELLAQARCVARWLHDQGYRGTASVDFHVALRQGGLEVRVCEINARVTGATYPAILARHFLPGRAWMMRNVRMDDALPSSAFLDSVDRLDALFRPADKRGILPINLVVDENGSATKAQVLCLGADPADCMAVLQEVEAPLNWSYDRD